MLRRKSGPIGYDQWTEALSRPLTFDNAEYLKRGKCNKNIYPSVFNKLSDYITSAFNDAALALNGAGDSGTDLVFALKRLNAVYRISLFFRDIKWIAPADGKALADSLKTAAMSIVAKLKPQADANPDIMFECAALERTANGETR